MAIDEKTGTRTDLGDDLLEKTVSRADKSRAGTAAPLARDDIADQLESVRILRSEGLLEDAKKILRRILIADPRYKPARIALEEIHEIELKQIFGTGDPGRKYMPYDSRKEASWLFNSDEVVRRLDSDLGLGIYNAEGAETHQEALSLFQNAEEMESFAEKLERDLSQLSIQDRMDIGISFLEMRLHDLAVRQFKAAVKRALATGSPHILPASALLGLALVQSGRAFDAISELQPVLADSEIPQADKTEIYYLMGRAQSQLGRTDIAEQWYLKVQELNPRYRDVEERLRAIRPKNTR